MFMKVWRTHETLLPQRDRIDRENVEIIASESLFDLYWRNAFTSIVCGNIFLFSVTRVCVIADYRIVRSFRNRVINETLTRIEEHDCFETSEFRIVNLDLV